MIDSYAMTVMILFFLIWATPLYLIFLQSRGTNHQDKMPWLGCKYSWMPFRHLMLYKTPSDFPSSPAKGSKVLLCLALGVSLVQCTTSTFSRIPILATFPIWATIVRSLPLKTLLCCNMLGRKNIRLLWSRRNAPSRYTTALNCYLMNIPAALLLSQLGRW